MGHFAWVLHSHHEGLLNYFSMLIHTVTVEELNNKARGIIHKPYGSPPKDYIRNVYHCTPDLPFPKTMCTFA